MANAFISPGKYIQGPEELSRLGEHAAYLGSRFFVILTRSGIDRVGGAVKESLLSAGLSCMFEAFGGECTQAEIDRITALFLASDCDVVLGAGGGKVLDTAKAVAAIVRSPVVIVPTVAASDAPCSALSVLYTPGGEVDRLFFLPSNPNLVLVDSSVIARAPARLLSAGMGDALATWFEATAAKASGAVNCAGGTVTLAGAAIARQCYDTLLCDGAQALACVRRGECGPALEHVIEANILLSGIGFESGGTAAAHPIGNGFTALPRCHHLYHGEKVAFATLVQLVLQQEPEERLYEVFSFCKSVDLPTTLADLGLTEVTQEELNTVAQVATMPQETMGNMPFPVTRQMVAHALWETDERMRGYLAAEGLQQGRR